MPFHRAPEGETGAWSNGRFVSHPPHEVKRYAGAAGYISSGARKAEKKPARVPPKTPKRCYTVPVMVTTVHPLRQMPLPCARAATENDKEIPSQEPMMKEKPIHQLPLVYKTNGNGSVFENDPEPVPFNDEQMDIIAAALAQSSIALRNEMQAAIDKP